MLIATYALSCPPAGAKSSIIFVPELFYNLRDRAVVVGVGNVVGKTIPGNDDVVKPVKEQAENKIDGAVALIMAVGRAMLYEKEDTLSAHIESYGIRSL